MIVIDYGSPISYQKKLKDFINTLNKVSLIICPTQGQLWQKTRAINIVLKQCDTPYFMVADMDMLFHPDFGVKIKNFFTPNKVTYFKVGILTEEESKIEKPFDQYKVKFYTDKEATGMTLFPTAVLKGINAFDEFYHGWGSEDTDVHVRLRNKGVLVDFNTEETLLLHQWHPKFYRSKESTAPYHHLLERINFEYIALSRKHKKVLANVEHEWGIMPNAASYVALAKPDEVIQCYSTADAVAALCMQLSEGVWNEIIELVIVPHPEARLIKTMVKRMFNKRVPSFLPLEEANSRLLETIISNHRNKAYTYSFNRKKEQIICTINLSPLQ